MKSSPATLAPALLLAFGAGCALLPPLGLPDGRRHAPPNKVAKEMPRQRWTANELAEALGNAQECEAHARHLLGSDDEKGWALLSACVRRRDFTDLRRLLSPPWLAHVERRDEGALLLAQVIAARGGDVLTDLTILQRRRVPIFSLRAALEEPETYAGRLLIMRGRATESRRDGARRALLVRETHVVAVPERRFEGSDALRRGDHVSAHRHARRQRPGRELRNVAEETGAEVVARADQADPFLEPHSDYVFLLRFDGAADAFDIEEEQLTERAGMASVLASFAPTGGRFEYAAHR